MVEVTQADISAARAWMQKAKADGMIRRGNDNDLPSIQAFARHRTEATTALEERVKLLEAQIEHVRHILAEHESGEFHADEPQHVVSSIAAVFWEGPTPQ